MKRAKRGYVPKSRTRNGFIRVNVDALSAIPHGALFTVDGLPGTYVGVKSGRPVPR